MLCTYVMFCIIVRALPPGVGTCEAREGVNNNNSNTY